MWAMNSPEGKGKEAAPYGLVPGGRGEEDLPPGPLPEGLIITHIFLADHHCDSMEAMTGQRERCSRNDRRGSG